MSEPDTISGVVARNAARNPSALAFVDAASGATRTWAEYDDRAARIAVTLAAAYAPGERMALQLPDGAEAHEVMLACERAGVVAVGIGARAGP
ncbi:MAG TPA: AMP-binding protein, partial [Acidimicrobiia bacterium]|nr:AMP-binding protein [Acidimicrobiia bacterium]